ncbi:MAG: fasciclin domain-containing protein [Tannerellaceae bacterium]
MKKIGIFSILFVLFSLAWVGCDDDDKHDVPTANILQLVQSTPALSTLNAAIDAADLESALSSTTASYTVFAPTNDAFAKLPEGTLESLLADPDGALKNILMFHAVNGIYRPEKLTNGMTLTALNGDELSITTSGSTIYVNGIALSIAPVWASNGIVYIIDTVLIPPVKPFNKTMMQIVEGSSVHKTLEAALIAAKLNTVLSDPEASLTLFAPTDAAFALLPEGTIEQLLKDPEGELKNILLYHVLGSKVLSSQLEDGTVATLFGETITISIKDGSVFVNNAKVIIKDIEATNGVIHVIDAVLIPEEKAPAK